MAGLPIDSQSNQTWNLWLFKTANVGDVVFATKGVNTCIGVGLIEGDYYYDKDIDGYNHRRKVNWITDKVYQYKSDTLKGYKRHINAIMHNFVHLCHTLFFSRTNTRGAKSAHMENNCYEPKT